MQGHDNREEVADEVVGFVDRMKGKYGGINKTSENMKVTVELSEIEALKDKINMLDAENKELKERIKGMNEPELNSKAVKLSYLMFDNYMEAVFRCLGFEKWEREAVKFEANPEHWLGKEWYNSDRLEVNVGAHVLDKFKQAFLRIGVIAAPGSLNDEESHVPSQNVILPQDILREDGKGLVAPK